MTSEPKPLQVLLIEDEDVDARAVRKMLSKATDVVANLTHVSRLADGIQHLRDHRDVNLVLLDLNLPDSKGLDTVKRVHEQADGVPIIVLSGHDDESSALNAVQRGVQDYLVKGQIDAPTLGRSLRYALARHQLRADLEQDLERAERLAGRVFGDQSGRDDGSMSGILSDDRAERLKSLTPAYQEMVIEYLRSVRTDAERPMHLVKQMVQQMASLQVRAKHVAQLHVGVLAELEKKTPASQRRTLANDARLLLLELLGRLMDLYLKQSQTQAESESVLE